jgi:hypothetical protein
MFYSYCFRIITLVVREEGNYWGVKDMKIKTKNIMLFSSGLVVTAVLAVVAAGCSSASSTVTSNTVQATTQATVTTTTTQSQSFQRRGANGTIAAVNGNILTVTTTQGQLTVNVNSSTTIDKTVAGAVSDLSQGQFVTVGGAADSTGSISATEIMIQQGQPPVLTSPRSGGSTTRPSGSFPGGGTGIGRQMTIGTISGINGSSFIVKTAQSQVTVNTSGNTVIQKTVSGTIADLQTGVFISVTGPTDSNGSVTANSISIRPAGQGFPGSLNNNTPS